jgi:hypothetical protein
LKKISIFAAMVRKNAKVVLGLAVGCLFLCVVYFIRLVPITIEEMEYQYKWCKENNSDYCKNYCKAHGWKDCKDSD